MTRLFIRVQFENGAILGPGKVQLLELVAETGSIRKAASRMKMSYRKAWLLLNDLKTAFGTPVVTTATGGRTGGGAVLTAFGTALVAEYRALEVRAAKAGAPQIAAMERAAGGQKAAGNGGKKRPAGLEKN